MSISRRSFFKRVAGVVGGGGLAAVIERQETPVDVPVQVIERVRCSKCGRLYEDGEKECRVCKAEDNKVRQISRPSVTASVTAVVWPRPVDCGIGFPFISSDICVHKRIEHG